MKLKDTKPISKIKISKIEKLAILEQEDMPIFRIKLSYINKIYTVTKKFMTGHKN
jgi:hypothetical protein